MTSTARMIAHLNPFEGQARPHADTYYTRLSYHLPDYPRHLVTSMASALVDAACAPPERAATPSPPPASSAVDPPVPDAMASSSTAEA